MNARVFRKLTGRKREPGEMVELLLVVAGRRAPCRPYSTVSFVDGMTVQSPTLNWQRCCSGRK